MKTKGFTLIELVMTLAILGVIAWIGVAAMFAGTDTWGFFTQRKEVLTDARMALDRMAREIRTVRNATSVATAGSTTFGFTDNNNDDIIFTISGRVINRTQNGTTNGLLSNVDSLTFTYYDASGSTIAAPVVSPSQTNIRRIRIAAALSKGASGAVNLRSDVWPRNLQ